MEDDVKGKFEDLDKRIQSADKRFDDVKWYFAGTTGFFTLILTILALITGKQNNLINKQGDTIRDAITKQNDDFHRLERDSSGDATLFREHIGSDIARQIDLERQSSNRFSEFLDKRLEDRTAEINKVEKNVNAALALNAAPPNLELLGPNHRSIDGQTIKASLAWTEDKPPIRVVTFNDFLRNTGGSKSRELYLQAYSNDIQFPRASDDPNYRYSTTIYPNRNADNNIPGNFAVSQTWRLTIVADPSTKRCPILIKLFYSTQKPFEALVTLDLN